MYHKWKRCELCNRFLEITEFLQREDRNGRYEWCVSCMKEQGREQNYPKQSKRGGGNLELVPRDT